MSSRLNLIFALAIAASVNAQGPPHGPQGPPPSQGRPPGGASFGVWWHDPEMIRRLNLAPDQQRRIDEICDRNRPRLIELSGAVEREQDALQPILGAERVDTARALAQIDRVAQARAELEKADARMLLSFRGVLSQEQWRRLQDDGGPPPGGGQAPRNDRR